MTFNWQGVVILGVLLAACVACVVLGQSELALLLGGAAVGQLGPSPVRRAE